MTTMRIIGIEKDATRGMISVLKELTEDDGTIHVNQHFFTEDTVEWKMAEYDTDRETALDIILHEPFTDPSTYRHLHEFDSKEEALEHAKQVIGSIKRNMGGKKAKPHDKEYKDILDHCVIHEEALALKRRHIDKAFEMKAREKEEIATNRGVDRIAKLKSTLARHERKLEA